MSAYSDSIFEPVFSEPAPISTKKYRNRSRNKIFPSVFIPSQMWLASQHCTRGNGIIIILVSFVHPILIRYIMFRFCFNYIPLLDISSTIFLCLKLLAYCFLAKQIVYLLLNPFQIIARLTLFDLKFDHWSYLKICAKYHFFCYDLLFLTKVLQK
jgi:hypothetical protein